jgi:Tfp pilus assembly protein PilN
LTAGQSIIKDLQPSLASAVGTPVQVTPFADHIKAGGGLRKKLDADFSDDTMADVLAPAATAARSEVNLIPEEILMKRNVEEQSKEAMVAGVLVVAVLILVGLILGSKNYFKETFLKKNLQAKYAGQRQEVVDLQEELRRNKLVKNLLNSRLSSLQVLRGLYSVIPNDIYLNTVTQNEEGTITVSGIAETTSRVYAFVSSLSESKFFDGVKTKSTSGKKDRGKDLIAFEIEFMLSSNIPEGDIKADDKNLKTPQAKPAEGTKGT